MRTHSSRRPVTSTTAEGALGASFVEIVAAPNGNAAPVTAANGSTFTKSKKPEPTAKAKGDLAAMQRELVALRNMVDELSAAQAPKERVRAMLYAAGFEGDPCQTIGRWVDQVGASRT